MIGAMVSCQGGAIVPWKETMFGRVQPSKGYVRDKGQVRQYLNVRLDGVRPCGLPTTGCGQSRLIEGVQLSRRPALVQSPRSAYARLRPTGRKTCEGCEGLARVFQNPRSRKYQ